MTHLHLVEKRNRHHGQFDPEDMPEEFKELASPIEPSSRFRDRFDDLWLRVGLYVLCVLYVLWFIAGILIGELL